MRERIVSFGENDRLVGVRSGKPDAAGGQGIIFLNAGVVPRAGPHRIYVRLARAFAEMGLPSFRFDFGGFGDSARGEAAPDFRSQTLEETKMAIATAGFSKPILIGLCSGSEVAYKAALESQDVDGLILLDPHSYPCARSEALRIAKKFTDTQRWRRAAKRILGNDEATANNSENASAPLIDLPDPPQQEWARDLETLTARGVDIFIRFTRYVEEDLVHPDHFFDTFRATPLHNRVKVEVDGNADHTYTSLASQDRLVAACTAWLTSRSE